jgi:transposase-like protein
MDTHKNAPLTPKGREAMVRCVVEDGLSKAAAACQFNVTPKTVAKWVKRFRAHAFCQLLKHHAPLEDNVFPENSYDDRIVIARPL